MRKASVIIILLFFGLVSFAQQSVISSALKAGDATALGAICDANVEIELDGKEGNYSKQQATVVLRDFFNTHKVNSYVSLHQGTSGSGSVYQIGTLTTAAGVYRVYVYSKLNGTATIIQEIRFEKE